MRSKANLHLYFSSVLSSLLISTSALAISPGGSISGSYGVFEGTINPFDLTLNGETINSGVVTYSLDETQPSNFIFDFDLLTYTYEVSILLTSPTLTLLGEPPQKITIGLTGPITELEPADVTPGVPYDLRITAETIIGGGVFGPGQLLSGWIYSNFQNNTTIINNNNTNIGNDNKAENKCDIKSEAKGEGTVQGQLINPTGTQNIPLTGSGTTSSTPPQGKNSPGGPLSCAPKVSEPSSYWSFLALGTLGAASTLKRKLKPSKSTKKETTKVG